MASHVAAVLADQIQGLLDGNTPPYFGHALT